MNEKSENMALHYDTHVFCCINKRPDDHPRGCCIARGSLPLQGYMKDFLHFLVIYFQNKVWGVGRT